MGDREERRKKNYVYGKMHREPDITYVYVYYTQHTPKVQQTTI